MTFPTYSIKGREVEYKTFRFQLKSFNEDEGTVTGYLSTFGNVDLQKDRVLQGAFKKTLLEAKARKQNGRKFLFPFLWMHSPDDPIGGCLEAEEDPQGLLVTMQCDITTNAAGYPNNVTATKVFSGYKMGYIDEMSMGYLAIQKDFDGGIRNLKECAVLEGSAVTMLFAANPEALVPASGVKSMIEAKSVCGDTSLPIGPRDASWDGSAAHKQIVDWATKEDGSIDAAKMKKVHLQCDGDADKVTSYGYAFCNIASGSPQINVGGVKACAGALSGARGADAGADTDGMKKKVATLYKRINKKYPDDPQLTPPWSDDGKRSNMDRQQKTIDDNFREEMCEDLLEDWQDVYICSLTGAIFEAFTIGDQPEQDISAALDRFKEIVLSKFVSQAMEYDLSQYLADNDMGWNPAESTLHNGSDSYYGYMSNRKKPLGKAGRAISAANQSTLEAHQSEMNDHIGMMKKSLTAMEQKVSDLTQLWEETDRGEPYGNDKTRTRREPLATLTRQIQPQKSTVEDDAVLDLADWIANKL